MAKNIFQMQLPTYQTNINAHKIIIIIIIIINKQTKTKTKCLLLFLIFQIVLAMKLNPGLNAIKILKKLLKKKKNS